MAVSSPGSTDFLVGDGEMARLVRSKDWSQTPLGPIEAWPRSLVTIVNLCLASSFPINILWGPEANQIYNDGYRAICGEAHPHALGESYRTTWASAWPAIGAPFEAARAGKAAFLENQRMFVTRNGYLEEVFLTYSLSPIRDEMGGIGGLFHPVIETTATMLAERRARALRDLAESLAGAQGVEDVGRRTTAALSRHDLDLPFLAFYGAASEGAYALTSSFGAPENRLRLQPSSGPPWPVAEALARGKAVEFEGVRDRFGDLPCGPYEEGPDRAVAFPLPLPGVDTPPAAIVAGFSPRLPPDESGRGFHESIAAAVGAAIADAWAREEERRRAETLAAIDRGKTAFFSNVSHEFRTPLTLMLGPLEDAMAEAASLPPIQYRRLDVAYRNALRLLKLVNSLLDFSRIEAGRLTASFRPMDLAGVTADLASNFRSACERAGLDLIVDCPPLTRPIYFDPAMWETVVLNLLSNAFKFTLDGRIEVLMRQTETGADLTIRDTGVGIPPDQLTKVFDRFHRVEGQAGRTYEGTGIGLSLVRELVELHGGAIKVTSAPRQGTTFTISVLAGTAHLNPDQIHAASPSGPSRARADAFVQEALHWLPGDEEAEAFAGPGPSPAPAQAHRSRVVLADDNADMRRYVRQILEGAGYRVEAVENGAAALEAIRRTPRPELVISDVMMPVLDGFQLVEAVRGDPVLNDLPIILLSAKAGEEARLEGLSSGADDYMFKPFTARELQARVDGVVRLARQRREASRRERDLHTQLATERARTRLRQTKAEMAFALEAGRLGNWDLDLKTGVLTASEICRAMFGLAPDEPYDRALMISRIHPNDRAQREGDIRRAIENHTDLDIEYRIVLPSGSIAWVLLRGRADYDADGAPARLAGVLLDITDRKRAEDRQQLLLDELNHRVKNTLATVQAIALQTRRSADNPQAFTEALDSRIKALANAHDLLTRTSWEGVSLDDLLRLTLQPYRSNDVEVAGPRISMGPNAAVTLNMAFHELATNAAKYGSLSTPEGSLTVRWAVDRAAAAPEIVIDWTETNGPMVRAPTRRGFGSRLLEQGVPREFGGAVALDYRASGLSCRMRIPLSSKIQAFEG